MLILDLNNQDKNLFYHFNDKGRVNIKINIFDLEQIDGESLYLLEDNIKSFNILAALLKKNKNCEFLINTRYPDTANLLEQISYLSFKENILETIIICMEIIKTFIKNFKKINITVLIHEFDKSKFLFENQIYNKFFIELMLNLKNEYKNIRKIYFNCIVTNNFHLSYKKKIYPYIDNFSLKNFEYFYINYIKIKNLKFNNKIFKL